MEEELIQSGEPEKQFVQYQSVYEKYSRTSSAPVAVLWQCGTFFNLLGMEDEDGVPANNFRDLCRCLGLKVTMNNSKKQLSVGNPLKAGMPWRTSESRQAKLLEEGYVVVVVRECEHDSTQREVAKVMTPGLQLEELESPLCNNIVTVYVEHNHPRKQVARTDRMSLSIGMCAVDISTGAVQVHEAASLPQYEAEALDEVYRFLQAMTASEVVIVAKGFTKLSAEQRGEFQAHISRTLNLRQYVVRNFCVDDAVYGKLTTTQYQDDALRRVYGEYATVLDMYPLSRAALTACVNAIYEYRPQALRNLDAPVVWCDEAQPRLVLTHNAVEQLDINTRGRKKTDNVFQLLDQTLTNGGKRMLQCWLLNPLTNKREIDARLDTVAELVDTSQENRDELKVRFQRMSNDVKRLLHLAELDHPHDSLGPAGLAAIYKDMNEAFELISWLSGAHTSDEADPSLANVRTWFPSPHQIMDDHTGLAGFLVMLEETFDLALMEQVTAVSANPKDAPKQRIFKAGVNASLDTLINRTADSERQIEATRARIAALLYPRAPQSERLKKVAVLTEGKGISFRVTKTDAALLHHYIDEAKNATIRGNEPVIRRWRSPKEFRESRSASASALNSDEEEEPPTKFQAIIKAGGVGGGSSKAVKRLSAEQITFVLSMHTLRQKSQTKISFEAIDECYAALDDTATLIRDAVVEAFNAFVTTRVTPYAPALERVVEFISTLDVLFSHARTAQRYQYHRPTILDVTESADERRSSFNAVDLRHPIVERLLQNSLEFIPNDVRLKVGGDDDDGADDTLGLVLTGINNGGKTTILRAVGLAVVMAQSGSFVAARTLELQPFHAIMTRLSGNDNMQSGKGTYAVEMSELRTILSLATPRTLVLCDEICRGTEYDSGLNIVAASILDMVAMRTNFLFATHLHGLSHIPEITELAPRVRFQHFTVETHTVNARETIIVYDRKLKEGSGPSHYGIEVAAAQGIPRRVIERAHAFRRRMMDEAETIVDTRHSRYSTAVSLDRCGIPGCGERAVETHHLYEQRDADERGVIDGRFHKHCGLNQMGLCKHHHNEITQNRLDVSKWLQTLSGDRVLVTLTDAD